MKLTKEILKAQNSLKAMDIDITAIDWASYSEDIPIEDYLKNEYGINLPNEVNKKHEEELTLKTNVENIKKEVKHKQKEFDKIIKKSSHYDLEAEEVIKAIKEYNIHGEDLVISTLTAVATGRNIINYGRFGNSKSWATQDLLRKLNIPFNEIKGHHTPKSFYEKLEFYNNSIICIDESANLLKNMEIQDILLSALQKGVIKWESTKERKEFKFSGTIIFNTNYLPKNPILEAVADRCICNKVKLKPHQLKERIMLSRNFKFNEEIWGKIKNNLLSKCDINDIFLKYEDEVYSILDKMEVKSMRDFERLKDIAVTSVKLTNTLELIKPFLKIEAIDIILQQDKKKSEIVKEIAMAKGISVRQSQRYVKKERNGVKKNDNRL